MAEHSEPQETRSFQSVYGDDDKKSAGTLRALYWEGIQGLRTELRDYWLNHAFLHGYQWLYWNEVNGQLDELPSDPERIQATVNRIWPNTRTIMGNLMQRHLHFEVPPRDVDDSHIRGAKLAETVLRTVHQEHSWETLREDVYYALWKGGTAAISVDWDPQAGEIMSEGPVGKSPVRDGDTREQHLNITQFLVEPGAIYPEKARYWFKAVALPPDEVKGMFDLEQRPPADATAGLAPFHRKLMSYDRGGDAEIVDLTLVLTYYERPNPGCEKGRVCTLVDNQIVFDDEWPFPFKDRLNLVIMRETPRENRWTGDTVVTAVRPLQTLLNVAWSSVAEHMKLAGNARLLIPMSSIEIIEDVTDMPGGFLPYNDAMPVKPDYLSPPQMPAWWVEMPNKLAQEIDDIMGVHDISRGSAPANIESGFGLTILAEKDTTPVSRITKETAGAFSRLATMVLQIYEQETKKTKVERKALVRQPNQAPLTVIWNGEDFRGQTYAYVPEDAILPRSRAAQMEMAKDMLQAGLIESIEDFMAVAELPGQRDVLAAVSPDVDRARRENGQFGLGRQSIPEPFDNHKAHIHEHNKYRKTVDYELLSDEDRQMVDDHVEAHAVMAAKEVGRGRAMGAIDPALAEAATSTEAPVVAPIEAQPGAAPQQPVEMPPGGPPMPGPQLPPGPLGGGGPSPDEAASEIMQLMQRMGG